jgi:hypothetical protein
VCLIDNPKSQAQISHARTLHQEGFGREASPVPHRRVVNFIQTSVGRWARTCLDRAKPTEPSIQLIGRNPSGSP